jgi:hypothetical protein
VDVLDRGTDNQLWHQWWDGGPIWQQERVSTNSVLTSAPAVASWGPNRLDVFDIGTDNKVWHQFWDGAWHQDQVQVPDPPSGYAVATPGAASWGAGRIDLFVRGNDRQLYHTFFDSGGWFQGWQPMGGQLW